MYDVPLPALLWDCKVNCEVFKLLSVTGSSKFIIMRPLLRLKVKLSNSGGVTSAVTVVDWIAFVAAAATIAFVATSFTRPFENETKVLALVVASDKSFFSRFRWYVESVAVNVVASDVDTRLA